MKYIKFILSIFIVLQLYSCKDKLELSDTQANSFIKYYGGSGIDEGNDVKQTSDDGYAFIGTVTDADGVLQAGFYKVDRFGNIEWEVISNGEKDKIANSFLIDNDGNFVLVGTTTLENDTTDIYLLKLTSAGEISWENNYGGEFDQSGNSIVLNDDNNLFVVGNTFDQGSNMNMLIILVNSTGDSLRSTTNPYSSANFVQKIGSDYIIAGITNNTFSIFKSDNNGIISETNFNFFQTGSTAQEVYPTADGNFIAAGTFNSNILISKILINDNLKQSWPEDKSFGGSLQESGNSVKVTDDNKIVIFGTTNSFGEGGNDMYLIITDSDGNNPVEKTYGGTGDEIGSKIELTSDGGFIMIGSSEFEGNSMICLIKTDGEGKIGE